MSRIFFPRIPIFRAFSQVILDSKEPVAWLSAHCGRALRPSSGRCPWPPKDLPERYLPSHRTCGMQCSGSLPLCQLHRLKSLCQRANLIHLHQKCISGAHADALFQPLRIGDKQIIPYQLNGISKGSVICFPALPVIFPPDHPRCWQVGIFQ